MGFKRFIFDEEYLKELEAEKRELVDSTVSSVPLIPVRPSGARGISTLLKLSLLLIPLIVYLGYHYYKPTEAGTTINTTITENDDLNNGLIGHWTFDGPDLNWRSMQAYDSTSYHSTGTLNNLSTTTSAVGGKIGQGMLFSKTDDSYLSTPGTASVLDDIATMTVSLWIKPRSFPSAAMWPIVTKSDSYYYGWNLYINGESGDIQSLVFRRAFSTNNFVARQSAVNTIVAGKWQHIVATWDGSATGTNIHLYVDGVETAYKSSGNATGARTSDCCQGLGYSSFFIGHELRSGSFDGVIDDVRVYNRVLPQDQIKRLYELGATTHINTTIDTNDDLENGLVLHWTFDGSDMNWSSTTAEILDKSASSTEGNIQNFTPSSVSAGRIGQGLKFDGVDDIASSAVPVLKTDQATFGGWFFIEPQSCTSGTCVLVHQSAASNDSYEIQLLTPGRTIMCWNGADGIGATIQWSTWTHILCMYNNDTPRQTMWVNGEQVGESSDSSPPIVTTFGIGGGAGKDFIRGSMDDIRVYKRNLSASEIKRLYELGATTHINTTIDTNDDLENGLVGHWTFDGPKMAWGSSTAEVLDSSASSIEGNLTNMDQSAATAGKMGQGMNFVNGQDGYMLASSSAISALSQKSVALWIKPRSLGQAGLGSILHKGMWTFALYTSNTLFTSHTFSSFTGMWTSATQDIIPLNTWTHVAFVYNNSSSTNNPTFYINGRRSSESEIVGPSGTAMSDAGSPLYIGNSPGLGNDFDGVIDDVRIYNRTLSASEVKRLYELGGGH